jgi:CspA family cold shock protein
MSKGKDFRGPRKRGFDDDMPSPYEMPPRTRPRPAFGGTSGGGGGYGGGADAPLQGGKTVDAVVKWFKGDKGFGFVELSDGTGDAFLHIGALQAAGHESVLPGSKLQVVVGQGAKGAQVTRVLSVDTSSATAETRSSPRSFDGPRPARRAPDPATAVDVIGTVKWFDTTKGFGFVASKDGGKDVFIHISVLGPAGISHLSEGQPVTMKVVDTPKGREAISLQLA